VSGNGLPPRFTFSPSEQRALEKLAELDRKSRHVGANVSEEAYRIVEGLPRLRDWLERSDRLVESLSGAKRLRQRRRRGVLRYLDGSLKGMPLFEPLLCPTAFSPEPRVLHLKDELDAIVVPGRRVDRVWMPAKDEITFDEARAIAMMKAGTLYRLTSKGLVPGMIRRGLGLNSTSHTTELRFLGHEYVRWAVVIRAILKSG
jgi:hypothetical protein